MLTLYSSPNRRQARQRNIFRGDRLAQYHGLENSDVHVPLDVIANETAYEITLTVPGLEADELEIEVHGDTIYISGEFVDNSDEGTNFVRRERPYGKFRRVIRLSTELDSAKVEANLKNGILSLIIQKAESALPKKVKIAA